MVKLLKLSGRWVAFLVNIWPPLLFTGIRFRYVSDDLRTIKVEMPLRFYNRNIIGVHYGGSLFSMLDPCYMMMLQRNLGSSYRVIDQSASIQFIKAGVGTVSAECHLSQDDIDDIIEKTRTGEKYLKSFAINIVDEVGDIVASNDRVVYIRKKRPKKNN